jgi:hypothetical protein
MRFVRVKGRILAFTEVRRHVGGDGRGKQRRIKLFTDEEPIALLPVSDFQDMVQDGKIKRLHLPYKLRLKAEVVSGRIGEEYTPQEALQILQAMIQEHATSGVVSRG